MDMKKTGGLAYPLKEPLNNESITLPPGVSIKGDTIYLAVGRYNTEEIIRLMRCTGAIYLQGEGVFL